MIAIEIALLVAALLVAALLVAALLVAALLVAGFLVGISVERSLCSEHRRARERARRHRRLTVAGR